MRSRNAQSNVAKIFVLLLLVSAAFAEGTDPGFGGSNYDPTNGCIVTKAPS